ncbi:MAG: Ku protein, partial [Gemmatimonadetes bacterium]|nr:Ku protein [Gemmatimonadota bacterium]
LNQLHKDCNQRIRYKKVCPDHGEVANDEIVSGFEHTKDEYVVIDPEEVQKLRKKSEKAVDIECFVPRDQLDPMYFAGRAYYLQPDGPAGQKPYQLLRESMRDEDLYAIGTAILSGRTQMVAIRPLEDLLVMNVLQYAEKVRQPGEFADGVKATKITAEEKKLTKMLVDATKREDFDYAQWKDEYVGEMRALIELKIEGQEVVAAPDVEEPKVINLMEALKASVEGARKAAPAAPRQASKKVATKMSPSTKTRAKAKRKAG